MGPGPPAPLRGMFVPTLSSEISADLTWVSQGICSRGHRLRSADGAYIPAAERRKGTGCAEVGATAGGSGAAAAELWTVERPQF